MAHVLTETPTKGESVTVPDGGDPRTAASVELPIQSLADRAKYCENHVDLLEARTVTSYGAVRFHDGPIAPIVPADWVNVGCASAECATTSATVAHIPLRFPSGSTLTTVYVCIKGGTGHGALPANKPVAKLYRQTVATGALTQIGGTITDAPANVGAYEAFHVLGASGGLGPTLSGLTEVTNAGYRYYVELTTESGANAEVGLLVYGAETIANVTTLNVE